LGGAPERAVAAAVYPATGRAWVVGVTGPPGAGKSTLVDGLIRCVRAGGERIAVVAVDPSSPLTGGALLGDRVRMQDHANDPGVFVRSMATRGYGGGLARATRGAVRVLDAAGWPWIVVETVGAGQVEVDVAGAADTIVVTVAPGWGDALQADKAGVLEVADVLVVNKADKPGADETARDLAAARPGVEIVKTAATAAEGVAALWAAVGDHRARLVAAGDVEARRTARLGSEVRALVEQAALALARARTTGPEFDTILAEVAARRLDPLAAAARIGGEAIDGSELTGLT
jgi:LAO/AO transport system kinase